MNPETQRLNGDAAATYLGLAPATLAKWRCIGGGPVFIKCGRRVVYDRRDLDAFMDASRRRSTSDAANAKSTP
jgi:hypothetical protein